MTVHRERDPADVPPRWLRALVSLFARVSHLPDLPQDLDDLFQVRRRAHGRWRASAWVLRQVIRGPIALALDWQTGRAGAQSRVGVLATEARRALGRVFWKWKTVSLPFVLLVGLGIAAAGAMAQIRAATLRPDLGIPFSVYAVSWQNDDGERRGATTITGAESWLTRPPAGVAALRPVAVRSMPVQTPAGWMHVTVQVVTPGFLSALGVYPRIGRDLQEPLDVVLSDAFWRAHWTPESGLGDEVFTTSLGQRGRVVGVAPATFDGPVCCIRPAAWIVESLGPTDSMTAGVYAIDVAYPTAAAEAVAVALAGNGDRIWDVQLTDVRSRDLGIGETFRILQWLSWLAFLGTVLNGAHLLLADIADRQRELRLRRALGASTARIGGSVALEVGWLAIGTAVVGAAGAAAILRVVPAWLPLLNTPDSAVDFPVGGAAIAAIAIGSAATAVLAGVPAGLAALSGAKRLLLDRATGVSRGRARTATGLLAAQVAVAAALGSVSLVHRDALGTLDGEFVGFRHGGTAVLFTSGIPSGPPSAPDQLLARLNDLPGIETAALSRTLPVYGARSETLTMAGGDISVAVEQATTAYLGALGTRLTVGEPARDASEGTLSEDAALSITASPSSLLGTVARLGTDPIRIVGIVETSTWGTGSPRPTLYRGWTPDDAAGAVLIARPAAGSPTPTLRTIATEASLSALAVSPFGTLDSLLVRSRVVGEFLARSASLFSTLCLVVALGGVSTHFRRWVRVRRRDFGIRLCLGASTTRAHRAVFRAALSPLAGGLAAGAAAAWIGARVMTALMPEAPEHLAAPILTATVLVAVLAVGALIAPALAAARTDPIAVLRAD